MRCLVVLACLALACTLRGDGERVEETRELASFTTVEVFDGFTATISVDPKMSAEEPVEVTISGDGNALERLFTVVHGEQTLSISVDANHLTRLRVTPEFTASVPALRRAYAGDDTALAIVGAAGELSLAARESASVTLTMATESTLTAEAHEDATLTLAGDGPALTLTVEDAATVDAGGFRAARVTVYARGDGEVRVCATEKLTIRGSGSEQVALDCD